MLKQTHSGLRGAGALSRDALNSTMTSLRLHMDAASLYPRKRPSTTPHCRPAALPPASSSPSSDKHPSPEPQAAASSALSDEYASLVSVDEWTDDERNAFTAAAIEGFITSPGKRPVHRPRSRRKAGTPPSPDDDSAGLQSRIVGHLLAGGFSEELLASAPPQTLNWVVKTLGGAGRLELAEQLFHWMRLRRIANEHSLVKLFEAVEGAHAPPARALQSWRNVRRMQCPFVPGERAAAALLKVYRSTGDLPGALRVLTEIQSRGIALNQYAFNVVIRTAADVGDAESALEVASRLKEHPGAHPDVRTFSALMSAVAASGRWSRTATVHKMLLEEGITPDDTLFCQLIAGYAGAARPESAEALMDRMLDAGRRPNRTHWNALLDAYAEARQYDGCLTAYRRMVDDAGLPPSGQTLVALLHAAQGARAGHSAASKVQQIMREYNVPLNVQLGTALIACCRHASPGRDVVEALAFADNVVQSMRHAGVALNARTYNSLLAVHADAGDTAGVKRILEELEHAGDVEPTEDTWGIALNAFQAAGWWDQVEAYEMLRDTLRMLRGSEQPPPQLPPPMR